MPGPPSPRHAAVVTTGNGLVFNADRWNRCGISDWHNTGGLDTELTRRGGAPGAALGPNQHRKEKYLTASGYMWPGPGASYADAEELRRSLVDAFPTGVLSPLDVTTDRTYRRWVAPYDDFTITWNAVEGRLDFTLPLVAPDSLMYVDTISAVMGAFAGSLAYRLYALAGFRTYDLAGFRTYVVSEGLGTYPEAAVIESPGDQVSRRITIDVTGPLTAGDWQIVNETTGQQMWVDITVPANKTLTLDVFNRTATLGGVGVDQNVYGDWPHLAKGVNTFRLSVGTTNDVAHATVTADPAYQ